MSRSLVDFDLSAGDHGCLHVAVTTPGECQPLSLLRVVMGALRELPPVQYQGTVLFLRFLDALPKWAMVDGASTQKWEDFTAHKQVLGVLTVALCEDEDDFDNLSEGFSETCAQFPRSLCSRCLVFGAKRLLRDTRDGAHKPEFRILDCNPDRETFSRQDINVKELEQVVSELAIFICKGLTARSRIEQLQSRPLWSPVSTAQEGDEGGDTRLTKNHIQARALKQLADLHLLCGNLQNAAQHYQECSETLRSKGDWLWAGAAQEGLGATALMTKRCEEVLGQKATGTRHTFITRLKGNQSSRATIKSHPAPGSSGGARNAMTLGPARPSAGGARSAMTVGPTRPGSSGQHFDPKRRTNGTFRAKSSSPDEGEEYSLKGLSVQDMPDFSDEDTFSESEEQGRFGTVEGVNGECEEEPDSTATALLIDKRLLQKDFIVNSFSDAAEYYNKSGKIGGLLQIEALIKCSKYLQDQERYIEAADMLVRVVGVSSNITEGSQVALYETMADLCGSMGFNRKAAMFYHYAGRQLAMLAKEQQGMYDAHALLLKCFPAYKLSTNVKDLTESGCLGQGWPYLRAQILRDFVFLAKRMDESMLAFQHSCFLLQHYHQLLAPSDVQNLTEMINNISQAAREAHHSNSSNVPTNGQLVSPFPLTNFPIVSVFQPKHTPLLPQRYARATASNDSGPFIYSALSARKKKAQAEVAWVIGEPAEIALEVYNPLPFELRVKEMMMITEGVSLEKAPSALSLPPTSEPQQFVLVAVPHETGTVSLLGYQAVVFGVRSRCPRVIPGDPIIRVVPPLPQLKAFAFPCSAGGRAEDNDVSPAKTHRRSISQRGGVASVDIMDGEVSYCEIQLDSFKDVLVEKLSFSVMDYNKQFCEITWNDEDIQALLPLKKNDQRTFLVKFQGKIPTWLRVSNDVAGLSQTVTSNLPGSTPSLEGTKQPTSSAEQSQSPSPTPPLSTPVVEVSPTSSLSRSGPAPPPSPLTNRRLMKIGRMLSVKRTSDSPALDIPGFNSSLIGSLSLEYPLVSRSSASLPNRSPLRQRGHSKGRGEIRKLRATPSFSRPSFDDYDFDRYGGDKRASVISDPGEDLLWPLPRGKASLKSRPSDSPAVTIPQSQSVSVGMSNLSREGAWPMEGAEFGSPFHGPSVKGAFAGLGSKLNVRRSGGLTKGNISLPTGPLHKDRPRPPSRKRLDGKFTLEYSGGAGQVEGYYRTVHLTVAIVIKPSLLFDHFTVATVNGSSDLFLLSFRARNCSKMRLELTCFVQQDLQEPDMKEECVRVAPDEEACIKLRLKRFILPEDTVQGAKNESETTKLYSDKVAEMVCVHWRAYDYNKTGKLSLESLRLPVANFNVVRPVPLIFDMQVNQKPCPVQAAFSKEFSVGEQIAIQLKVTNNSGLLMPPSLLMVELTQFSMVQKTVVKIDSMVVHSGNLVSKLPPLQPGDSYEHLVTLVFLRKGSFCLDVKSYNFLSPTSALAKAATASKAPKPLSRTPISTKVQQNGLERDSVVTSSPTPASLAATGDVGPQENGEDKRLPTKAVGRRENGGSPPGSTKGARQDTGLTAPLPSSPPLPFPATAGFPYGQSRHHWKLGAATPSSSVAPVIDETESEFERPSQSCRAGSPMRHPLYPGKDGGSCMARMASISSAQLAHRTHNAVLSQPSRGPFLTLHIV